jgi:hypothetical protein
MESANSAAAAAAVTATTHNTQGHLSGIALEASIMQLHAVTFNMTPATLMVGAGSAR